MNKKRLSSSILRFTILVAIAFAVISCAPGEFAASNSLETKKPQTRSASGTPEIKKAGETGGPNVRKQEAAKHWLDGLPGIIRGCSSQYKQDYAARKDCIIRGINK